MQGKAIFTGLLMLIASLIFAQLPAEKYQFGISAGAFIYQGDLTPYRFGSFKTPGISISFFASRKISRLFSVRANIALGKLRGNDSVYAQPEYRQQRNFNFTSPVVEASALLVWDVFGNDQQRKFSPYAFAGAGYSFLNIKRDWSRFNTAYFGNESEVLAGISLDTAHSLPKGLPVIPVGIGIKYLLTQKFSLFAESAYRFVSTDYLDGFSQAANPDKKDSYQSYSVGILYRLRKDNTLKCPVIKY